MRQECLGPGRRSELFLWRPAGAAGGAAECLNVKQCRIDGGHKWPLNKPEDLERLHDTSNQNEIN